MTDTELLDYLEMMIKDEGATYTLTIGIGAEIGRNGFWPGYNFNTVREAIEDAMQRYGKTPTAKNDFLGRSQKDMGQHRFSTLKAKARSRIRKTERADPSN